ncbi:hypothetical protein F511_46769 [Dorcoceras hygrometricum]|uniref:Uncharacterized protein n=1 Tax=Dorcoceras hygrometricum TaxID=472368 RepID=A0A2Z6ZZJ4_9LAMI|nr:hypothetical protein F511_46769 [Dorcoceras hygrometricum]
MTSPVRRPPAAAATTKNLAAAAAQRHAKRDSGPRATSRAHRTASAHRLATSAQQASTSSVPSSGHGVQQRAERRYNGRRNIARPARRCRASSAQHCAMFCTKLPQLRPALRIQHAGRGAIMRVGVVAFSKNFVG